MWATIVRQCRDRVVLLDEVDDVVAIWGSKLKLRLVGEVRVYRLDFLEVHPARPGVGIGAIAMGLVADQAARDGAKGIVLSSLPQSVGFYEALGGSKKLPGVWNAERGTVPFYFDTSAMGVLRELLADAQADG
ncbi:MAG: GNAT family N-acetyltransferase [Myxococcales bacterium]|nr:GNAT family N-acetyltransferase [Myxococcales bacterium]